MACVSLVSCLPALEDVELCLDPLILEDLGCLLEALACLPRLTALVLHVDVWKQVMLALMLAVFMSQPGPLSDAPAFAQLRSLTKLGLLFQQSTPLHTWPVSSAAWRRWRAWRSWNLPFAVLLQCLPLWGS